VVLATDASDTMDCEEVKDINNGRNQGRDVTSTQLLKLKLTYFGHVVQSDGLEKTYTFRVGTGGIGKWQDRRRWMDEVVVITGLRLQQLKEAARDKVRWEDVVRVVTRGRLRPDGTR